MDDDAIERDLREAQANVLAIERVRVARQAAVRRAIEAGWTKYRIAKTMGVGRPTVDSIIETSWPDQNVHTA